MFNIVINKKACNKCQLCAKVCSINVIKKNERDYPIISSMETCFRCGHCVAVCPQKAVIHSEFSYEQLIDRQEGLLTAKSVTNFLATKRSCRFFTHKKITPEIWEQLTNAVSYAPTAFNCEERAVTVINDTQILSKIRNDTICKAKKTLKLFQLFLKRPFKWILHESSIAFFKKAILDFETTINKCESGEDGLFHNAPYLVIISSVGKDTMGKDYCLAACHYMMLQAKSLGIGSAINGFVQAYPEIISRYVTLPHMHKAFAVMTMGYPSLSFQRSVTRKKVEFNIV